MHCWQQPIPSANLLAANTRAQNVVTYLASEVAGIAESLHVRFRAPIFHPPVLHSFVGSRYEFFGVYAIRDNCQVELVRLLRNHVTIAINNIHFAIASNDFPSHKCRILWDVAQADGLSLTSQLDSSWILRE